MADNLGKNWSAELDKHLMWLEILPYLTEKRNKLSLKAIFNENCRLTLKAINAEFLRRQSDKRYFLVNILHHIQAFERYDVLINNITQYFSRYGIFTSKYKNQKDVYDEIFTMRFSNFFIFRPWRSISFHYFVNSKFGFDQKDMYERLAYQPLLVCSVL